MLVNSLAIAVDLGISFVGLIVSIILFYSVKLANRPADFLHNYGYGKVEHVCEILEGIVLIGIALAMSFQSIVGLLHPDEISMPWIGFSSSLINSSINFVGAYYIFKMARKSGSPAIHAEGLHYKLEGFISSSIAVAFILSIVLHKNGYNTIARHIDPIAALLISIFLIVPSFKLAKKSFFNLLDASVGEDSRIEILKHLSQYIHKYCEFRDLRTRTAGRNKFVEFKLVMPEDISVREGARISHLLEKDIKAGVPHSEVLVKIEPCDKDCEFYKKGEPCPYVEK